MPWFIVDGCWRREPSNDSIESSINFWAATLLLFNNQILTSQAPQDNYNSQDAMVEWWRIAEDSECDHEALSSSGDLEFDPEALPSSGIQVPDDWKLWSVSEEGDGENPLF